MQASRLSNFYITEDKIIDWDCCFNCVFAKKWRSEKYSCRILQLLKQERRYKGLITVFTNGSCKYIIKRPKFCAETYGYPVIIYEKQNKGIRNQSEKNEWYENYLKRLEEIKTELNLRNLNAINTNFSWSFTTSKYYTYLRNKLIHTGNIRAIKYTCSNCNKKYYSKQIEIHHICPKSENGSHSNANLDVLCLDCHKKETLKQLKNRF